MDLIVELLQKSYQAAYLVSRAAFPFLQEDSYLYWPYMISTLVIGMLAWRFGHARRAGENGGWRTFFKRYCGADLWWHASARADYWFYLFNAAFMPLVLGPLLLSSETAIKLLNQWLGAGVSNGTPGVAVMVLYTALFFIVYDFGRFVAHSLLHDVPALWHFHKVHHSAEVLTLMTSFRAHPVDLAVMVTVPALTTGVLTWAFHRYVDGGVTFYTFLGVHVLFFVGNLIGNLRHWQVWLSYGKTLNNWLISPAHHQLHHSAEPRHWGCNRGFEVAVWDRLYGTLCVPQENPEDFRMGLGDGTDGQWHSVWRMYVWPFAMLFGYQPKSAENKKAPV